VGREATLTQRISETVENQEQLDRRMGIFEERMMRQFIAMERILSGLNSSGGFLENLFDALPFTSKI
jgi:flagellar hook-associated protein 2